LDSTEMDEPSSADSSGDCVPEKWGAVAWIFDSTLTVMLINLVVIAISEWWHRHESS
jgi:hypothetical protein